MCSLLYIDSPWEKDHIFKNLLRDVSFEEYFFVATEHLTPSFLASFKKESEGKPIVLVFSTNTLSFTSAQKLVDFLNPRVVFSLSDEHGKRPEFLQLSSETRLVLSQYLWHHKHIGDVIPVPVSYLPGVLPKEYVNGTLHASHPKRLDWAFVGAPKSDRKHAVDIFSRRLHKNFNSWKASRHEVTKAYMEATFVLCPRGYANLMTCRVFEALYLGAIPVVVSANANEIKDTFDFHTQTEVPFVTAGSWETALDTCEGLLRGPDDALSEIRKKCATWILNIDDKIRDRVGEALKRELV